MQMKPVVIKNEIPTDTIKEDPGISFQHLSFCFFVDDAPDDYHNTAYGFPVSQEEGLYQTCFLMKEFLKC